MPRTSKPIASDERGTSEVVGAMLLVLIVTVAVAGFGKFIFDEQERTQEAKALQNAREREMLTFLDIDVVIDDWFDAEWIDGDPMPSSRFDRYKEITFTLQGAHADPFQVEEFILNGDHVKDVTLSRFDPVEGWQDYRVVRNTTTPGHPDYTAFTDTIGYPIEFAAREKFRVTVNLRDIQYAAQASAPAPYDADNRSIDFYSTVPAILSDRYVQLEVMTGYFNKFSNTWVPATPVLARPAPVAPENTTQSLSLDATSSFHPFSERADDVDIIAWDWQAVFPRRDDPATVTPGEERFLSARTAGETATLSFADTASTPADFDHNCFRDRAIEIVLFVTADNGMISTSKSIYTPTGPWNSQANCPT